MEIEENLENTLDIEMKDRLKENNKEITDLSEDKTLNCAKINEIVKVMLENADQENEILEEVEKGITISVLRNQTIGLYRETNVFQDKKYQNYFYYDVKEKLPEKRKMMKEAVAQTIPSTDKCVPIIHIIKE